MPGPLVETKFHMPVRRSGVVTRAGLEKCWSRSERSALTLVSAPAGFGKTTAISEWLTQRTSDGWAIAWLSLDASENDPVVFWSYLASALRFVLPDVGAGALAFLEGSRTPTDAVVGSLLNDLVDIGGDVVLVLDDYHVIEASEIHEAMAFFVEHLPPRVHLVLATRSDPTLPLARIRSHGDLVEIRANDLRFTSDEAAAYLNQTMGLHLTNHQVAALEERTEGWIAALQLAALSMQGRDDVGTFIEGFAGDDRYIVDYLVGEVLRRQPQHVQDFLLQTSVLSRMTGSLCTAVTGRPAAATVLEMLERANMFLVPLDDRRQWYRYHHLFLDVLRARLRDEQPERVSELHQRASDWFEENHDRLEGVRHAIAGENFARAANLIELAIPAMRQARQDATLRRMLEALPDDLFEARPVLAVGYAGVIMASGDVSGGETLLGTAERWLDVVRTGDDPLVGSSGELVVADVVQFRRLPTQIATFRAMQALVRGDVALTVSHAQRALDHVEEDDALGRGSAAAVLGLAYWTVGDLDAGKQRYVQAIANLHHAGHLSDAIGCSIALADILVAQGLLDEAMHLYESGLKTACSQDLALRGAADMHVGLSELSYERNDLVEALGQLGESEAMGSHAGTAQNAYRWHVSMARLRAADGDSAGALALLEEAEDLFDSDFSPDVRPVAAVKARVNIARGEVGEALRWAQERHISTDDDLSYVQECEHLTLARLLIARDVIDHADDHLGDAAALLDRLLDAAEQGHRTGSIIEILTVRALVLQASGDNSTAVAALERALMLAGPARYVRIFLDEGPPLIDLLVSIARQGPASEEARRVLDSAGPALPGPNEVSAPDGSGLFEALSAREHEVLRLLRTDLSGPEIARELVVSLHTVRTHTKHIYSKLGVNDRRAAVRRANDLDL